MRRGPVAFSWSGLLHYLVVHSYNASCHIHVSKCLQKLKGELTGNFESAVVTFMMQPAERDATLLRKAMDGMGTDEQVSWFSIVSHPDVS